MYSASEFLDKQEQEIAKEVENFIKSVEQKLKSSGFARGIYSTEFILYGAGDSFINALAQYLDNASWELSIDSVKYQRNLEVGFTIKPNMKHFF